MNLPEEFAKYTITAMLAEHPQIGEILRKHNIDCVSCSSSSCLFKNVTKTHAWDPKQAIRIETELNDYFASVST